MAGYYRTKENARTKLFNEWNKMVQDEKNKGKGLFELANFDDSQAEEVYHLGAAYKALGGDFVGASKQISEFIDIMESKNVEKILNVKGFEEGFKAIREASKDLIEGLPADMEEAFKPIQHYLVKNVEDDMDQYLEKMRQQTQGIQEEAEKQAAITEELFKKQKKASEKLNEVLENARKKRRTLIDDADYNRSDPLTRLSKYSDIQSVGASMESLQGQKKQIRANLDKEKLAYEKMMANMGDSSIENLMEKRLESISRYAEQYENAESQIEYLNRRLNDMLQESVFQSGGGGDGNGPSGSWNEDTINAVVRGVQSLVISIRKLSQTFDTLEEESPFNKLLQQVQSLSEALPNALNNTNQLDGFKDELNSFIEDTKTAIKGLGDAFVDTDDKKSPFTKLIDDLEAFKADLNSLGDDNGAFGKLLGKFDDIKSAVGNAFDTSIFTDFKAQMESLATEIGKISNMTVNGPTINVSTSGQETITRQWEARFQRYLNLYNTFAESFEDRYSMFGVITDVFNKANNYVGEPAESYGLAKIQDLASSGTVEGYRGAIQTIINYFTLLKQASDDSSESIAADIRTTDDMLADVTHRIEALKDIINNGTTNFSNVNIWDVFRIDPDDFKQISSDATKLNNFIQTTLDEAEKRQQELLEAQQKNANNQSAGFAARARGILSNVTFNMSTIENQVARSAEKDTSASAEYIRNQQNMAKSLFGDNSDIINVLREELIPQIETVQRLLKQGFEIEDEQEVQTFFSKLAENVGALEQGVTGLNGAFSQLNSVVTGQNPLGLTPEQIQPITDTFKGLETTLTNITTLLKDTGMDSKRISNVVNNLTNGDVHSAARNAAKVVEQKADSSDATTTTPPPQTNTASTILNTAALTQRLEQEAKDIGKVIPHGIVTGMREAEKDLYDATSNIAENVLTLTKNIFAIASPSGEFEEIGRYCIEGAIIGFVNGRDDIDATINSIFDLNKYALGLNDSQRVDFVKQFTDAIVNQFNIQDTTNVSGAMQSYVDNIVNGVNINTTLEEFGKYLNDKTRTILKNSMGDINAQDIQKSLEDVMNLQGYLLKISGSFAQSSDETKSTVVANIDAMIAKLKQYQDVLAGTDNKNLIASVDSSLKYFEGVKSNLEQYGTLGTPAGSQPRAVKDQEVKVKIDEQSLLDAKGHMQDMLGEIEVKVNPSGQLQESSQVTAGVVKGQFDEAFKIIYNQIALLKQTLSDPNLSGLTITLNSNIGQQIQIIEEAVKGISKRLSTAAGTVVGDAVAQKADDITVTPDQKKPQETGVPIKIITDKQNLIDAKAKIEQAFSNILITIGGLSDASQQNLQSVIEKIQGIQTEVSNAVSGIISDFNGKPEAERTIYLQTNFDELYANIQTKLAEIKTFTSTIKFEVDNKKNLTTVIQDVKGVSNTIDQVIETTADKYKSLLALFRQNGNKEEFAKSLAENFSHDQLTEIAQMEKVTIPKKSSYKLDVRAERLASAIQERDAALQVPDKATEQYSKILTEINAVRTAIADLIKLLGTAPEKSVLSEEIRALQGLLEKDIPAVEGLLKQQSEKIDASVNASIQTLDGLVEKIGSVSTEISTKIEKPIGVNVEVYGPSKENIAQVTKDIEQLKQLLNSEATDFKMSDDSKRKEDLAQLEAISAKLYQIITLSDDLEKAIEQPGIKLSEAITAPNDGQAGYYTQLINTIKSLSDEELKFIGLSQDQIDNLKKSVSETTSLVQTAFKSISGLRDKMIEEKINGDMVNYNIHADNMDAQNQTAVASLTGFADSIFEKFDALHKKVFDMKQELSAPIETPKSDSSNLTKDFEQLAIALREMVQNLSILRSSLEKGIDLSQFTAGFQALKGATYGISGNISSIADKLSKIPQIDLSNLITQYTNLNVVTRGIDDAVEKVNSAIRILGTNKVLAEKIGELQSYLTTELDGLQSLVQTIQTYGTTNLTVVSADSGDLQNYVGYLTEISKVLQQLPFDMEQVNAAFEVLQDVIRGVLKTASESVLGIAGATATLVQDINKHDIAIGVDSKPIVDEITRIQGLAQQILSHFTSTIEVKSNIDTEVDYINNRLKPLTDSTIEVELEVKSDIDTEVDKINTRAAEVANKESFIKVDTDVDTVVDHIKEKAKEVESMQVGLAPIDTKTVETIVGQIGQVNSALEQLIPSPTFITAGEQIDALRQKFMDLVDVFRSNKDKDAFVTALQGFKKTELEQIAKYDGINVNASHSKGNTKDVIAGNIGDKVEEGLKRKSLADEPMQAAVKYEELFQKVKAVNEQVTTLRGQLDTLFSKQAFPDEGKLFTNLLDVLSKEIPKAILAKNNKFREEVTVVKGVVTDEVNELNRLKKAIEDVVSAIDFKNLNMNELNNVSAVFQTLEKLINSSSLKDFYDTMEKLAQTISAFNLDANNNNVFSRIEGMLSKTQELENLVKILAETEQRIKAAELALNGQNNNRNNNNGNQTPPGGGQHQWSPNSHQRWTIPNDAVLDDVFSNVEDNIRDRVRKDVEDAIGRVVKVITSTNVKGDLSSAILVGTKGTTRGGWKTDPKTQQKSFEFGGVTSKPFDEAYERKIDRQMDALDEYEKKLKDAGLWTKEFNDQLDGLWLKLDEADDSGEFFDGFKDLFDKFKTKVDTAIKDADKSTSDSIKTINKLAEARSNYNETVAKNIKDPLVTTQKDVQKAADVVKEAYEDAKQAMQGLIDDKNNQKVSKEQYIAGLRAFNSDDALYGSQESRNEIRNAKTSNVVKDIKAMADAYSKLNTQEAQDISKGGSASVFDRKTESTKEYMKALDKAKSSLKELLQTEKGIDADEIFNLLYADDANDPQKYGQVHQMYEDLIAMGNSIDDKKLDEFFDKLQKVSKADAFAGSSSSREGIGKSLASQYNIAEKALDKLAKALDKVQKYQEKLANGENVAGRLTGATNNLRDAQKDAAKIFATVGKYNQRYQIPGYKELEDKYNNTDQTAQDILNGGMSYNLNDGFKDASKGYETLAKGATNYYKILKKIANEELLSSNELRFMETVKDYYDKATKSAEEFERQLGVKSDDEFQIQLNSNRNKFLASMPEARKKVVDSVTEDLESQITKLNQKPATGQFGIDFRVLSQDYEDLVAQISKIDWNGTSEQDFKDLIIQLEEIQKRVSELNTGEQYQPVNDVERQTVIRKASEWQAMHTGATEANAKLEELKEKLKAIDDQGSLNNLKAELEAIKTEAYEAGEAGMSFGDKLRTSFSNLTRYLMSFASFYRVIGALRQGVEIVHQLDSALKDVKMVVSDSTKSLQEWQLTTFDSADAVGGTAIDLQKSVASWVRLGKTFEEANEAAQASIKLMNVSEFTSIEDSTGALLSMTQAFDNLGFQQIIDQLNGVGDSFSSSTSQLAEGMKNVAQVLQVSGNSFEQSLALLAAGNNSVQDMSKASMGIRTIALRLAGTEQAKKELEDLGENVDDFVVQTQSKVDAQVRALTRTASNPNGISVLDDNGRLRSTYDIGKMCPHMSNLCA